MIVTCQWSIGQWRGPGFNSDFPSPSKIPYSGFSPVRLQGQHSDRAFPKPPTLSLPPQRAPRSLLLPFARFRQVSRCPQLLRLPLPLCGRPPPPPPRGPLLPFSFCFLSPSSLPPPLRLSLTHTLHFMSLHLSTAPSCRERLRHPTPPPLPHLSPLPPPPPPPSPPPPFISSPAPLIISIPYPHLSLPAIPTPPPPFISSPPPSSPLHPKRIPPSFHVPPFSPPKQNNPG